MKNKAPYIVLAVLLFLCPSAGHPQTVTIPAELITSDSGMMAAWVFSMAQDRLGFIWFGTNLGVVRHDGLHYKVFRRANTLPNPLSNDYILAMTEDAAGNLWLGSYKGLNRFDPVSETFSVFLHDPKDPGSLTGNSIYALARWSANPDSLWVATAGSGLGLFDMKTGKCRSFRADPARPGALGSDRVYTVLEDSRKRVWAGTANGLHRFLPASESFEVFRHDAKNANTIGNDNVYEIFESPRHPGILWVGTGKNCLNRFDAERREWQRFLLPAAELPDPFSNGVYYVKDCPNEPDVLLVGTRQGLYMFHMLRQSWQRVVLQDQYRETGDPRNEFIQGIFHDRSGVCWVSVQGRGLLKFRPQEALFRSHVNPDSNQDPVMRNRISGMAEGAGGRLWLGTLGAGLYRYDSASGSYEHFTLGPSIPDRENFDFVHILCSTRRGELWAATSGGLVRFDPQSGEQEVFAARPGDAAALGFTRVAAMREDSQGDVWIGSDFCLLRWVRLTRTFKRYLHDPGDPGSLSSSHVNPILEDVDGNLWVGTENGLNVYVRTSDQFKRYYLDPPNESKETQNYVLILHQDVRGRIWVATSNGLNLMETTKDGVRFTHYSDPSSTVRNFILGVLEDDDGNLWISSGAGLSRFDTESRTFSIYDSHDGVPLIEPIYGVCLRAQSGELFFGGSRGMFSFRPWLARLNRYVPPLVFTDIQVWRRPLAIGGASPLRSSIALASGLVLPYNQNSLTLSFAALSYIRPEKNQYAYRLDGRDDSWHDLGFEHSVNLDNLKPGRYRLRVRGSNNEGVWNEDGISLLLHIRPPFWQTWWFRLLAALAVIAFIVQLKRTRARRQAARIRTEAAMDRYCEQYHITPREREIIRSVLKGKSNHDIEDELFISMGTVKNHIYRIFQKLGIKNRGQLIALFKNLPLK